MTHCKVSHCRFANSHVTLGHKCGTCNLYGHGQIECNKSHLKSTLLQYTNDILPINLHCTINNCEYKELHCTSAHNHIQLIKPHIKPTNPTYDYQIECPICTTKSNVPQTPSVIFGLSDKCKVCTVDDINTLLPCKHACLCSDCYSKLVKKII
jgi:hypothetical protein